MAAKVMIAVLALLGFVAGTSAVTCQSCQYSKVNDVETGTGCKDPYSGDYARDCAFGEFCLKMRQSYSESGQSYEITSRSCSLGACTKEGEESGEENGHKATLYCCKGDNCNSGGALMPALCMLVASLLFTAFF